ncbi:MAG: hypothetical protein AAGJ79_06525 [Verrucomicrobiota bacterium]
MDQSQAIETIEEACKTISIQFMKIGPAIHKIEDADLKGELIKQSHTATTALEVIKKQMIKLKGRDDSKLL